MPKWSPDGIVYRILCHLADLAENDIVPDKLWLTGDEVEALREQYEQVVAPPPPRKHYEHGDYIGTLFGVPVHFQEDKLSLLVKEFGNDTIIDSE